MRRAIALALAFALFASQRASAAPTSKLVYSRSVDAASCPDEQALRRAVAARIGYDPFFPYAPKTIVASLSHRNQTFVATVDLIDENGVSHGARELHVNGECGELLDTVALAIAIAIDPQSLSRAPASAPAAATPPDLAPSPAEAAPPAPAPQVPEPPSSAPAPARSEAPPPSQPSNRVAFEASAGLVASVAVAPSPSIGAALGVGVRWRAVSLALEGRLDAPAGKSAAGGGAVSSWLALGALVPCLRLGPVFGCGVAQVGSVRASGTGEPGTRAQSLPWRAVGGRVGVLVPLTGVLDLRLRGDLVGDLEPMTLRLNGSPVWTAPSLAASLAVELVVHF